MFFGNFHPEKKKNLEKSNGTHFDDHPDILRVGKKEPPSDQMIPNRWCEISSRLSVVSGIN